MAGRPGHRSSRRGVIFGGGAVMLGLAARRLFAQADTQPTSGAGTPMNAMLSGKTALVTGSTDGLGRAVAVELGTMGATVIVHGRNVERGREVVQDIEAAGGRASFYAADLGSLAQVDRLAAAVASSHDALHILINNAGIWSDGDQGGRRTSVDGHELVFAVNYLSHFLLTHRLLPLLVASAPSRIINVASAAQRAIDFGDVMLTRNYSDSRAYAQSKLAQVMFTFDLARELEDDGVTVNALHPATLMDTTMVRLAGATPRSTIEDGLRAVMRLAVSPELDGRTGSYFIGTNEGRADPQAYDPDARAKLRTLSMQLTGLL